jgi:hypothetical protein
MVQDHLMTCSSPPIATKVLLTASTELGRSGQRSARFLPPMFSSPVSLVSAPS